MALAGEKELVTDTCLLFFFFFPLHTAEMNIINEESRLILR